jgi:hypothetical protein
MVRRGRSPSNVPPFFKYAVIPFARKEQLPIAFSISAATARRRTI